MISLEDIRKILEVAVHAPSGENCQPWRFIVKDNKIDIFNIPEKDLSLYNFRQLGSFVAHGALIENIVITSSALGYKTSVNLFPNQKDEKHVATVVLEKSTPKEESLYPYITKRVTNRKSYKTTPLTQEQKKQLLESAKEIGEGEVRIIEDSDKKKELAKALTVSDRLLFEVRKIHDFLFGHISWTEEEALERKSGFYVKEMELSPPQEKAFKLFRNWNILNFFNKLGFSKMAAKGNTKLYAASSAFAVVLVNGNTQKDFVIGGRIMQRVWLKTTKMGLSVQPVTGVIFFIQRILGGGAQDFSSEQINLVKNAYKTITDTFEAGKKVIPMFFRIGDGGEPTARSLRLSPNIEWL